MGKATYQLSWERTYPWIKTVNGDQSKAFCKSCQKSFSVSGSGEAQVKSHAKSKSHNDKTPSANQSISATENGKSQLSVPTKIMFNSEEQVLRADVLQVLQVVNSNYSFSSSENDNERFKIICFLTLKLLRAIVRVKQRLDVKFSMV